jgi:hypothetical protein
MSAAYATTATEQDPGPITSLLVQEPVTITLGVNMTDPDNPTLTVPPGERRIRVGFLASREIKYLISTAGLATGTTVTFDNPPITFAQDSVNGNVNPQFTLDETSNTLTLNWLNDTDRTSAHGTSFYYTLHAIVVDSSRHIPVSHDPTVHNDPPG